MVAQRICAECPVSPSCLEYALEHHIDHGVWGGAPSASAAGSCAAAGSRRRRSPLGVHA